MRYILFLITILALAALPVAAQEEAFVFGDLLPDAPELAARGEYSVGYRSMELVDEGRVDILSASESDPSPLYDRPLLVRVWYPAALGADEAELIEYTDNLGRADNPAAPNVPFIFMGRAAQDAEPDLSGGPYPLVIVSHGFPGSGLMMTYLTENLASKGYVVISIDHTDSTFTDTGAFGSTLVNRTLDQWFVIDAVAEMSAAEGFMQGLADADNSAIVGYSMGGYGALAAIGAGYNGVAANFGPGANLDVLVEGNETYLASQDDRIKAAVLFAPWGGNLSGLGLGDIALWNETALAEIEVPTFWVVGDMDDVSLFAGVERLFNWSLNSDRTMLIYDNALHNVAPNPPPAAAVEFPAYERYSEPAWDERRLNNINQHFVTAFLGLHLKGDESFAAYLDVAVEDSNAGVYSVTDGAFNEDHTYWPGFTPRTALGMHLRQGE